MYERFFRFHDQPFRLTPDPRYLFLGNEHREGYAHLLYAMREGSGFVCVSGEVGTGKTTLVRSLLSEERDNIAVAYIFNPVLSSVELLQTVNAEFGLPARTTSKKELTDALGIFLDAQRATGGRAVIIVDEAQNLDPVVLEQLRLLSNLETATEKLLQIILLGQPELDALLERPELRQLSQRIALRWQLEPLDRVEAHLYLRHRLAVAGREDDVFDDRALDVLYEHTSGLPRLMNILAHRSLLVAYTKSQPRVTATDVAMAAHELEQGKVPLARVRNEASGPAAGGWFYKAAAAGAVALASGVVAFLLVAPLGDTGLDAATEPGANSGRSQPRVAAAPGAAAVNEVQKASVGSPALRIPAVSRAESSAGTRLAQNRRESGGSRTDAASTDEVGNVDKFERRLARSSGYEVATGSMSGLIELWGRSPLAPAEIASGTLDLQLLGARRGLRYMGAEMTLPLVELIDLPALFEFKLQGSDEVRYVLLKNLDERSALVAGDREARLSRSDIERLWTGKTHLLWSDGERLSKALIPGTEGPQVEKLQKLLSEVDLYDEPYSQVYDERTQDAVRRFQISKGLMGNGVADIVTQIVLYKSISRFERPSLGSGEGVSVQ
jgi:general secretion pathway protein A